MKKRIITTCLCLAVVGSLGLFAGCSESGATPSGTSDPKAGALGAPALQPADHEGKFERGGSSMCYGATATARSPTPS